MKMKKARRLISMLMLLTVLASAPAISVHAGSVGRTGQGMVGSVSQSYTAGTSQVYANLITKADGTVVRYVYSKNYLNAAAFDGTEDTFGALKSVLTADYAALIPDKVDESLNGKVGFFFCSDSSLEKYVNDNWTSAEYVASNFLTVNKEGASYTNKSGGAVNTSKTAARQNNSNRFELIKTLVEEANKAKWEALEKERKAAWDAAEAEKKEQDSTYIPQEYKPGTYVELDFGELTGDDIQGKRNLEDSQIDLAVGCNLKNHFEFDEGKLVEVTDIEIIDHVATIYSEHAIISESSSSDEEASQAASGKIFNTSIKIKQKSGKLTISFAKTKDISRVDAYLAYANADFAKAPTKDTSGKSITIDKIDGKKLNLKNTFKLKLKAYNSIGQEVGESVVSYFAGKDNGKFTNPESIKLNKSKYTIKKGKSAKIKATIKRERNSKKLLSQKKIRNLRYVSANPSIAKVSASGKITGVSAGKCDIYVYGLNGLSKKVKVTVK
jgi:hypothetical protein